MLMLFFSTFLYLNLAENHWLSNVAWVEYEDGHSSLVQTLFDIKRSTMIDFEFCSQYLCLRKLGSEFFS